MRLVRRLEGFFYGACLCIQDAVKGCVWKAMEALMGKLFFLHKMAMM